MPKTRAFRVLRCLVCGFPFSDGHHTYPQAAGGSLSEVIALCPNHHRCAHMIYAMIEAGASDAYILRFGEAHFDEAFQVGLLDDLLTEYRLTKAALHQARSALSWWLIERALTLEEDF